MTNDALTASQYKPSITHSAPTTSSTIRDLCSKHINGISEKFGILIRGHNCGDEESHVTQEQEIKGIPAKIQDLVDQILSKTGGKNSLTWKLPTLKEDLGLFREKLHLLQCPESANILKALDIAASTLESAIGDSLGDEETRSPPHLTPSHQFYRQLLAGHIKFEKPHPLLPEKSKTKVNEFSCIVSYNLTEKERQTQEATRAFRKMEPPLSMAHSLNTLSSEKYNASADISKMLLKSLDLSEWARERVIAKIVKICPELNVDALSPEACDLILDYKNRFGDAKIFYIANYTDQQKANTAALLAKRALLSANPDLFGTREHKALELVSLLFRPGMQRPRLEAATQVAFLANLKPNAIWDRISGRLSLCGEGIEFLNSYNELRNRIEISAGEGTPSTCPARELSYFLKQAILKGSRFDETLVNVIEKLQIPLVDMKNALQEVIIDMRLLDILTDRDHPLDDMIPWLKSVGLSKSEIKSCFADIHAEEEQDHFLKHCIMNGYGASHLNFIKQADFSFEECRDLLSLSPDLLDNASEQYLETRVKLLGDLADFLG
ncbi:hypothetical protein QTI27_35220 [Variovorax sp. J31P216]|nr:hypothetical protein [Variovorax sp. J31P216]